MYSACDVIPLTGDIIHLSCKSGIKSICYFNFVFDSYCIDWLCKKDSPFTLSFFKVCNFFNMSDGLFIFHVEVQPQTYLVHKLSIVFPSNFGMSFQRLPHRSVSPESNKASDLNLRGTWFESHLWNSYVWVFSLISSVLLSNAGISHICFFPDLLKFTIHIYPLI
jgi:hypothetical protein